MILFVNTHLLPDEKYGGVVYSGNGLMLSLAKLTSVEAICVSDNPLKVENYYNSVPLKVKSSRSLFFHRFGFSLKFPFDAFRKISSSNFIFINGIFTFPVTISAFIAILLNKPFAVSIRGGLEPWRLEQKRIKKLIFNKLILNLILQKAKFIHVTCLEERDNLKISYQRKARVLPNGIDTSLFNGNYFEKKQFLQSKKHIFNFIFVSRMSKEKGLDILLEAFDRLIDSSKLDIRLTLIGPDNNGYLEKLLDGKNHLIKWIPGVYGEEKFNFILNSDVLILPSYSENFGNIVLESLALYTPVITTDKTPWYNILPKEKCGWICTPTTNELLKCMQNAITINSPELLEMGIRAKNFAHSNYTWDSIVKTLLVDINNFCE